ncbi:MAG: glutathione peroxidase [Oceanicoccus sp.]|jgi:glutathione peroxidase
MRSVHQFSAATLDGSNSKLEDYKGKVLLIVNTASKCGLTRQYQGLEQLYQRYHEQGLEILGFPCNQFGQQEPGNADEIQSFCLKNYGVSFPMYAKIDVNGESSHPLYQHLKTEAPGLLGSKKIKWNFTKFLIAKDGQVIKRFAPTTKPEKLTTAIEQALAN